MFIHISNGHMMEKILKCKLIGKLQYYFKTRVVLNCGINLFYLKQGDMLYFVVVVLVCVINMLRLL